MSFVPVTKDNVEEFANALGFTHLVKEYRIDYFDIRCPIRVTDCSYKCEHKCKLADVAKVANTNFEIGEDVCPLWRMNRIWNDRTDARLMLDDSLLDGEVEDI